MTRTVWGRATSSNVQLVMWALAELGLDAERIDLGGVHGGTDTPAYRAMNPMGRVPTYRDDRVTIWESAAILRYLAARHGDEVFWPRDPAERATQDIWAEWIKTTFVPVFNYGVFWPIIRVKAAERDEAALEASVDETKFLALVLEDRLQDVEYLGGEGPSFADVMVGHLLYRYFTVPFERAETPALRAYYDRLTARPAYAEHVMVSYDSLRVE